MKISDVLWKAANEKLWDGKNLCRYDPEEYSCLAVDWSDAKKEDRERAMAFLKSLGVRTGSAREFPQRMFPTIIARQMARYNWLMFAHMIAKEEGL